MQHSGPLGVDRPVKYTESAIGGGHDRSQHPSRRTRLCHTIQPAMATRASPPIPPLDERPNDSERDALTRALERSEARFQQLVHRAGYAIYRSSPGGRFLFVNPALVRMLGYSSEEELHAIDLATDLYVDSRERQRLRLRLQRHGRVDWLETRWKQKDGTPITVRLCVWPVLDEHGHLECYEGIAEDVTDRVRSDELLRRTERMACLGATLAGVAHELNNPLAAILGFAQLLLRKPLDAESRGALETIDHEASRAGKIVRDLLTLARKREAARHTPINLNDVVAYIVQTRRYALETHSIACVLQLDPALPPVLGDRTQLEQVVLNLLNNAEQAIRSSRESGGSILIRTRREGANSVVELEDDGPGIPACARERIWDPFWTTKEVGAGTGLGLAVVHGIVAAHGGVIDVQSAGEDAASGGARFLVRLPGLSSKEYVAGTEPSASASTALDVLVVDSDLQESSFLTNFLTSRGHAALAATDIGHALRLAEVMPFDAVICEASLAGSCEILHAFRSLDGCASARFVVAASGPETTMRLPMPLPPGAAVVMRPYDLEELRVLLED